MTVTEFLEARIAEDEAHIASHGPELEWCQECGFCQQPESPYSVERLLAECAAKRAIVAELPATRAERGRSQNAIIEALAAVYSDHPDYNKDWAL